uniref:Uncharacterized protein At2g28320 n=1 Tax=Arabidopsis thaliana TaxID=3702 RepID=Q9SKN8_ARATH|nr:unknown protein [Arabidopsis thaliana]
MTSQWDDHPAIMAVGVVDGTSETIFQTLLSLGPSRSEWDFCFYQGSVVEHLDGHTDIIHKQLYSDWLPWGMKRRDFSLRRYWRREDDGTYGGGYVISPIDNGKQSVVKHMLAVDWKSWRSYVKPSLARSITVKMLGRISGELSRSARLTQNEDGVFGDSSLRENEMFKDTANEERDKFPSERSSLVDLDEFFDVPEPSDNDNLDDSWTSDFDLDTCCQSSPHATCNPPCCYGTTLPTDPSCDLPCSWTTTDPSTFLIRGKTYLDDQKKVKAKGTLMEMVAADWLKSDKREDDLGSRPGGIVQVPGSTTYSLVLYYMMSTPIEEHPLLVSFVNGDDAYRNSRFKLIPYISKGSWIVKQSVGKKACLIGQALEINYFRGKNYIELGVDIGSSTVARGVVSLVLGYLNKLVIEMAFLIQANTEEELPEYLLGTCRFNHLDASKAISIIP